MATHLANDPFKRVYPKTTFKKPLIISKDGINRLKTNAQLLKIEEQTLKRAVAKKEKEACKELLKAMTKKTEAGAELRKRQYAKDVNCVQQELETKAKVDAQRNQVLDKAYRQLFEETDRVKYFKTAKEFCETQKHREEQIAAKASKEDKLADYDAQFVIGLLRDLDNYKEEEREKNIIKQENRKKNAQNWIKQHNEVLQKRIQEKKENLREGFLIAEEIEKERLEAKRKTDRQTQNVQDNKVSLDSQIKEKLAILEMQRILDRAESEKARLFNDVKKEMEIEHNKIRLELVKKKTERQKFVANNMVDEKAILRVKEAETLQKVIRQTDDKLMAEEAKKELEKAEAQKAIDEFYNNAMKLKQEKKFDEKLKKFKDKRIVDDHVEKLNMVEKSKQLKQKQLTDNAHHIQMHQIKARQAADKMDKMKDLEDYLHHMRGLDKEEEMFQKYAEKQIEDCEKRCVDTYAMKKAARPGVECGKGPLFKNRGYIRPRYYAAGKNAEDLPHIKRKFDMPDTKSRLGFLL